MTMALSDWEDQLKQRIHSNPELQTWENHLEYRFPELRDIFEAVGTDSLGDFLEIGCGNGIGSAYFSKFCRRVVASDLPSEDQSKHSIGLGKAKRLFEVAGVEASEIVGCSAESLPFGNESFDTVFSLYSLEHLPHRETALSECLRVLRPGGRLIAAVPAAGWAVFYPIEFYAELTKRVFQRFIKTKPRGRQSSQGAGGEMNHRVVKDWKSFRETYPHFPLPKPHGEYKSYLDELKNQAPHRWVKLLQSSGFQGVEAHPLSVIPRELLVRFLGQYGKRFYFKSRKLDKKLCRKEKCLPLAQFICLIGYKH